MKIMKYAINDYPVYITIYQNKNQIKNQSKIKNT